MSDHMDDTTETMANQNGVSSRTALTGQASVMLQTDSITSEEGNNSHPMVLVRSGDSVDARSIFDVWRTRRDPSSVGRLSTAPDNITYNMGHKKRGKCLIFNHRHFDLNTRLNERRGTERDASDLSAMFRSLDFEVHKYDDLPERDVHCVLESVSKENHSECDCLVVCILTHGEQGLLWARESRYKTELVFDYFKGDKCPTLASKPKMFFIQACQGDKLDSGVILHGPIDVCDAGPEFVRIPSYADFLIAYSTVPGFYSWRNTQQGSWFIQSLNKVFSLEASRLDLVTMLTIVSRHVAYDYESHVPGDPEFHQRKQIPCITSMLTRLVYFTPKP